MKCFLPTLQEKCDVAERRTLELERELRSMNERCHYGERRIDEQEMELQLQYDCCRRAELNANELEELLQAKEMETANVLASSSQLEVIILNSLFSHLVHIDMMIAGEAARNRRQNWKIGEAA